MAEMITRHQAVNQKKADEAAKAQAARANQDPQMGAVHRGGNEYKSAGTEEESRVMKTYVPSKVLTQFTSTSSPEVIFNALQEYFNSVESCTVTPSESHFKLKADVVKPIGTLSIKANIASTGDQRAVTITKSTGNVIDLLNIYKDLIEKYPFLPDGAPYSN